MWDVGNNELLGTADLRGSTLVGFIEGAVLVVAAARLSTGSGCLWLTHLREVIARAGILVATILICAF